MHDQLHFYYREGEYENCQPLLNAWFDCIRKRPPSAPASASKLNIRPNNDVWNLKKVPSWNDSN